MAAATNPQDPNQQPDYNKDYWAPDRSQVLAANGVQDTSGKTWNGTTWVAGGQAPTAPTAPAAGPPAGGWTGQAGWDTNKLNDPTHSGDPKYSKYDWLRSVESVGGNQDVQKVVDYFNKNYGGHATYGGSGDLVNFGGDVGNVDVLFDQEGARQNLWAPQAPAGSGSGQQGLAFNGGIPNSGIGGYGSFGGANGMSAGLSGSGSGAYSGSSSMTGGGVPFGNYGQTLWDQLMKRSGQSLDVNSRDPIIAAQVNSYRAEQDRGARNYIDQQAESGGPYSNLNAERRLANEHAAQSTGSMQAQLMQNELTARRAEITQALQEEGQFLTEEQRMALQRELGLIDAGLRQQGITNQNNQFLDQMGFNTADRASYWDAIRSGLLG
jgi:hypothetical protein